MSPAPNGANPADLVLSVLYEAKQSFGSGLPKTELTKFIYLLDVLIARHSDGRPLTGFEWKFLHFGPYAVALENTFTDLAKSGRLDVEAKDREAGGEYALFTLRAEARPLEALGVGANVAGDFRALLKRLHGNLNKLLNYVYQQTEPMSNAKPGEILAFDECIAIPFAAIRPVEMPKLSADVIERARKLFAVAHDQRTKGAEAEWAQGPVDEAYVSVINELDSEGANSIQPMVGASRLRW